VPLRLFSFVTLCLCLSMACPCACAQDDDNPTLLERLRSQDAEERSSALVSVLFDEEKPDPEVLNEVTRLLDDSNPDVRAAAVEAYLAHDGDLEIGGKFLSDPDGEVRGRAFSGLQEREPELARSQKLLADPHPGVRSAAVESFLKLGGDAAVVRPMLSDPAGGVRREVFEGLQRRHGDLELARTMLSDADSHVRREAVNSFLQLGGDRAELVRMLSDPVPFVRASVALCFFKEGLYLDQCVGTLISSAEYLDVLHLMDALGGERAVQVASQLVAIIRTSPNEALVEAAAHHIGYFDGLRSEHSQPLIEALSNERVETRRAAAETLRKLACDCTLPVEPLLAAIRDEDLLVRVHIAATLLQLEREEQTALASLRPILDDSPVDVQSAAVSELKHLPRIDPELIPELMKLLGVDNEYTRSDVSEAFSRVPADQAVPQLVAAVEDPNALVTHVYLWESIARVLGSYGTAAQSAVPALIGLSNHADPDVVFVATSALGTVGIRDRAAINRLHDVLSSTQAEQRSRVQAVAGLLSCAADDESLRSELRVALRTHLGDDDLLVRAKVAAALVTLGEELNVVAPAVGPLLNADDLLVQITVENLLASLGNRVGEFWQLIDARERDAWFGNIFPAIRLHYSAPTVLTVLGTSDISSLVRRLDDENPKLRGDAARTLGMVGPAAADAVQPLIKHLDDDGTFFVAYSDHTGGEEDIQEAVIRTLGQIGPAAAPAVPKLLELLAAIEEDFLAAGRRAVIVEALGGIGPDAIAAAPVIWPFTESEHETLRINAACALARIAPEDPRVIPALQRQLQRLGEPFDEHGTFFSISAAPLFDTSTAFGERATELVSTLEHLASAAPVLEHNVRIRAAETALRIDPDNAISLAYLRRRSEFERRGTAYVFSWDYTARKALDKLIADGVISAQ
jgi:HEAT repeat protein